MKILILSFSLCFCFVSNSQTVDYDDVAVIINDNSQTSVAIGYYFKNARNIPDQNLIHISAPTTEAITITEFELIRTQIEDYLVNNNLVDSINYIVTTKGVPLKIDDVCFELGSNGAKCASFDSELCLILSPYASQIGLTSGVANPIFNSSQPFSRAVSNIFLVTRLTGYTKYDVYDLIIRSGFETGLNQVSAQTIFDLNNVTGMDSSFFYDTYIAPGETVLNTNNWTNQVDHNFDPLLNQDGVFAYLYYGFENSNVSLNYTWKEGSIAAFETSSGAWTFDPVQNSAGNFLLADVIAEGCTGGHAFVNPNYYSFILRSDILFDRYLNPTVNYNLAESFYMAEPRLSWQGVVVGDPKASVIIDNTANLAEPNKLNLSIFPNPTQGKLTIESSEAITSVEIYAVNGVLVRSIDTNANTKVELDLQDLDGGVYLAHIFSNEKMTLERIVLAK